MATTLARQIQRAGTTAEWSAANPVLAAGEFGVDKTLARAKLGDGVTAWSGLGWVSMSPTETAEVMAAAATIGAGVDATDGALASALSNPESESATVLSNTIAGEAERIALDMLDGLAITSGPDVAAIGDSRTQGAGGGGTTWPSVLQAIIAGAYTNPGTVRNLGVGGETTATIIGRASLGTPWLATVVGGAIPTSGSVTVTLASASGAAAAPLIQGTAGVNPVKIAGVTGTLTLASGVYTFTPTSYPASPVTVSGAVPVSTQAQRDRQSDIQVFVVGQNDAPQTAATIIEYLRPAILRLKALRKRYIVVGLDTGTEAGRAAMESELAAEFGANWLNLRAYMSTTAALIAEGITPTTPDTTAIDEGSTPPSFWATSEDSIHRNAAGYRRYARAVYEKLKALGYNDQWGTLGDDADEPSSILMLEDFAARANGSSILSQAVQYGTGTWGALGSGTATIDAGRIAAAPSGAEIFVTANPGAANGVLAAKLATKGGASPFVGLVFRLSASNTYGVVRGHPTGNVYRITTVVAGTATDLAVSTTPVADGDEVELTMNGSSYSLKVNGVVAATATDSALTGTACGFYVMTATTAQRWASIRLDALPA